ncbi:MAG: DUF2934 domain-containing protein [Acidobacteriia bacterium]|nr:DUF2934 domain-containing protein [Terriglobia bacterium]
MAKDAARKTLTMAGAQPQSLEEQIRQHEYGPYEERGRADGNDLDEGLRAEEEITHQKAGTVAA